MHEVEVTGGVLGEEHDRRAPCAAFLAAGTIEAPSPKSSVICRPTIGCTPSLASFSENSKAPNRLLLSVIAKAGILSATANLASLAMFIAPSRSE